MKFTNALSTSLLALALPAVRGLATPHSSNLAARQNGDIQTSLTLDPSVICTGCAQDGQDPPVAGQVPSLTSTNNFINFCQGKTLTDGQQKAGGSCNAVPMGQVIPQGSMPSSKISFPPNNGEFPANTPFTFTMNVQNMRLGNFVNAQKNYFGAPQQVEGGIVTAHSHVTVQLLPSLDSTAIPDPKVFAFFKGLNSPDVNGVLSTEVTAGLAPGVYRFCSMNTAANHQPVNVAVAQHGSLDDCIYATAVDPNAQNGNNNNGNNGQDQNNGQNGDNQNGNNGQNGDQNNGQNGDQNNVDNGNQNNNGDQANNGQNGDQNNGQNGDQNANNGQNGDQANNDQNGDQANNGQNGDQANNGQNGDQNNGQNGDQNANNGDQANNGQNGDQANNDQNGDQANNGQNGDQANNGQNGDQNANNGQNGDQGNNDQANNGQNGNQNNDQNGNGQDGQNGDQGNADVVVATATQPATTDPAVAVASVITTTSVPSTSTVSSTTAASSTTSLASVQTVAPAPAPQKNNNQWSKNGKSRGRQHRKPRFSRKRVSNAINRWRRTQGGRWAV